MHVCVPQLWLHLIIYLSCLIHTQKQWSEFLNLFTTEVHSWFDAERNILIAYNDTYRHISLIFVPVAFKIPVSPLQMALYLRSYVQSPVLARISKMPVQNSNFKITAHLDLATYLLQTLIPATINSLVCQKGQFTLQLCPRRWFVRKIFGYYTPKVKNILSVQTGGF